jgi:putative thioredoxin
MLDSERNQEAGHVIEELEKRGYLEPEAEKLKARLHLAAQSGKAVDLDVMRAAVAADPKSLTAKLELAEGLAAGQQYQEALETALAIVQSGKKEFVEPARRLMVDLFHLLEDQPELVTEYRRRLSTSLY